MSRYRVLSWKPLNGNETLRLAVFAVRDRPKSPSVLLPWIWEAQEPAGRLPVSLPVPAESRVKTLPLWHRELQMRGADNAAMVLERVLLLYEEGTMGEEAQPILGMQNVGLFYEIDDQTNLPPDVVIDRVFKQSVIEGRPKELINPGEG